MNLNALEKRVQALEKKLKELEMRLAQKKRFKFWQK